MSLAQYESLVRSALLSLDVMKSIQGEDKLADALRRIAMSRADDCRRQAAKLIEHRRVA